MRARSPREVSAALRLARWPNALIAAAGVVVGAWFTMWIGRGSTIDVGLAALAALCLTATANAWNDIADLDIDRVAHPSRPLVTGELSISAADRLAMAAATLAVICASAVSVALGACTVGVLLLMRLYSPWLKREGFAGNLLVAVLASLPFLYGAYAAGPQWERAVPLVLIAIPLHLARELAKDLDDRDADRGARRTLPLVAGAPVARIAIGVSLIVAGVIFARMLVPMVRDPHMLVVALLPAALVLAFAAARAFRGVSGSPAFFKLGMVCAMAALLIARA
ncbi:MAG: UbiA family prenyltransferase [Gemmatimonadaceae bacterium]